MGVIKGNNRKGSGAAIVWWCLLLAGLLFLAVAAEQQAESGGQGVNTKEDRRWCKKDCEWKKQQCLHGCKQQQEQQKGGGEGDDDDDKGVPKEEHGGAFRCRQECKQRYRDGDERQQCLRDCEISPGGRGREGGDEPHDGWETAAGASL